jgi:hypothetical protein
MRLLVELKRSNAFRVAAPSPIGARRLTQVARMARGLPRQRRTDPRAAARCSLNSHASGA